MLPATSEFPADLPRLPPRDRDSSKRDYGRVVIVGGAPGMAGAPALAAMAALKSGAGLVEVLVPEAVATITAGFDPCMMTRSLANAADGTLGDTAAPLLFELPRVAHHIPCNACYAATDLALTARCTDLALTARCTELALLVHRPRAASFQLLRDGVLLSLRPGFRQGLALAPRRRDEAAPLRADPLARGDA